MTAPVVQFQQPDPSELNRPGTYFVQEPQILHCYCNKEFLDYKNLGTYKLISLPKTLLVWFARRSSIWTVDKINIAQTQSNRPAL